MLIARSAVLAVAGVLAAAAPASADTVTIAFKDTAGAHDPVAGVGRTLVITGNTPTEKSLYVKARAPGGAPCASSANSDSGSGLASGDGQIYLYDSVGYQGRYNGDFTKSVAGVWTEGPGTWMFCAWLAPDSDTPVTPITQLITFRAMTGSISGTVPGAPVGGSSFTASITGSSEGPAAVYAKVRSAGGASCSTSYGSDSGVSVLSGNSVNGAFSFAPELRLSRAGDHVLCLWLADSSSDTAPISGPQPVLFSVRRPCIVPTVRKRLKLKGAQKRLGASGCTAGSVRFKRSRWVRRGRVIRFRPGSGKRLAPGAKVVIVVSRGR